MILEQPVLCKCAWDGYFLTKKIYKMNIKSLVWKGDLRGLLDLLPKNNIYILLSGRISGFEKGLRDEVYTSEEEKFEKEALLKALQKVLGTTFETFKPLGAGWKKELTEVLLYFYKSNPQTADKAYELIREIDQFNTVYFEDPTYADSIVFETLRKKIKEFQLQK